MIEDGASMWKRFSGTTSELRRQPAEKAVRTDLRIARASRAAGGFKPGRRVCGSISGGKGNCSGFEGVDKTIFTGLRTDFASR